MRNGIDGAWVAADTKRRWHVEFEAARLQALAQSADAS
jgi:hypothetical protein